MADFADRLHQQGPIMRARRASRAPLPGPSEGALLLSDPAPSTTLSLPVPITHPSFSGHESFPLRHAWLKKGVDALERNSKIFSDDSAMVELGVGKNMVKSMRHWGMTCGVWTPTAGSRGKALSVTAFGRSLFGARGVDPFLEEVGTTWFLHWKIVTNPERATTWNWVFGRPKGNVFGRDEVVSELETVAEACGSTKPTRASLKRDFDTFVRSYVERSAGERTSFDEDELDSPFRSLGLLRALSDRGRYELVEGAHPGLPVRVFAAAVVDYLSRREPAGKRAVRIEDLLYSPHSPGRAFRLSEEAFMDRLASAVKLLQDSLQIAETAGVRQLLVHGPLQTAEAIFGGDGMRPATRDAL